MRLNFLLVARYFLLVACYFLLVARYFLLVARYFLLVARYFLLVARYFLLAPRYFCVWCKSRELGGRGSPRFPSVTPVAEGFSSDLLQAVISYWADPHLESC